MSKRNIKSLYVDNEGDLYISSYENARYKLENSSNNPPLLFENSPEELGFYFVDYFLDIPAPSSKLQKVKQFFKEVFQEL